MTAAASPVHAGEVDTEAHTPYKAAVIDWPPLPPDMLARLTALPIWDMAVQSGANL